MGKLNEFFQIEISTDKMRASLIQVKKVYSEIEIVPDDFVELVKEYGITYGVKDDKLTVLQNDIETVEFPVLIAEGKPAIDGEAAYVKVFGKKEDEKENTVEKLKVNYKDVLDIPSVTEGEVIGVKVPAEEGTPGLTIFNEEVPAKAGKDFKLRPGKNTRVEDSRIISLIAGQVSIEKKKIIHVYPAYEVNGDLNMKTGNITFVGHVNIRGNVPSGFEVKAKGDIRVQGTVESATLISEGSIYVGSGIAGQGKGNVQAKGDLHATFLNQATVSVEGDILVSQSILHSRCEAKGSIFCHEGKGNIVGGVLSAGKEIIVKDIGNSMNTATALFLGVNKEILEKEKEFLSQIKKAEEELKKLKTLQTSFSEKEKTSGLTANERILVLRIRNTISQMEDQLVEGLESLEELKEEFDENEKASVKVMGSIFPNVEVTFGKYRRKVTSVSKYMKILLKDGEIILSPL